jgi:subtilase family serine protease
LTQRSAGIGAFVSLPLRNRSDLENLVRLQATKGSPLYHHFLTPAQFRAAYGPLPATLAAAEATLQAQGFVTQRTSSGVYITAQPAIFEHAFGTKLNAVAGRPSHLVAGAPLVLPQSLATAGATVLGFGTSRGYRAQSVRASRSPVPDNRYSNLGPYWFTDMKQAYEYPAFTEAGGRGQTIGIVGYQDFLDSDIKAYFNHEQIAPPSVTRRFVAGGPAAADPLNSGLTQELQLDIVMAGGSAPHASLVTYLGPTPAGADVPDEIFITPFIAAVEDNLVNILTTSFGGCEAENTPFFLQVYHNIFLQGNAQGMTFIFSSGDNGSLGCGTTTATLGVEYPASDPNVTAVGGSVQLLTSSTPSSTTHPRQSKYAGETSVSQLFNTAFSGEPPGSVWGSGGGISQAFAKPSYQTLVNTSSNFRTVPDLALQMGGFTCNDPSYPIVVPTPGCLDGSSTLVPLDVGVNSAGGYYGFVGTSSSAPQFAGLLALQEQLFGSGREGNANYLIYLLAAAPGLNVYHDNIPGNNGTYHTHPGYNYVLGNGTVRGAAFVLEGNGPVAGDPWTPSNP